MSDPNHKLTPEQIANWRRVLALTLGPYAFMMPEEEIQRLRDVTQKQMDRFDEKEKKDES